MLFENSYTSRFNFLWITNIRFSIYTGKPRENNSFYQFSYFPKHMHGIKVHLYQSNGG